MNLGAMHFYAPTFALLSQEAKITVVTNRESVPNRDEDECVRQLR